MDLKNSKGLFYNVMLWVGLLALWVAVFQNNTLAFSRTVGTQFCYLVFIALNFYFSALITIPRFLNQKKYVLYVFTGVLFVILTAWLRTEVAVFINTRFYNVSINDLDFSVIYVNSLVNIFVWTVLLIAGKIVADKIKHERYLEAIEKEKIVNELNFLRAQHNPHFLFNSLNSIYFQIDKTNPEARKMLMMLSEMLRYQLYECSADKIPIDKEVAYLENYIELQRLRLSKNYNIEFNVEPNVTHFKVAPLLIMPLIENAFKYVSHHNEKTNEIYIHFNMVNDMLECAVSNTIEKVHNMPSADNGGIGLKNLQRRLELLYPGKHEIDFENNESMYMVKLALSTNEN